MSETSKHTPGPWRVESAVLEGGTTYTIRASSGKAVIQLYALEPGDAHLIAAAPDLLDACERVVLRYEFEPVDEEVSPALQGLVNRCNMARDKALGLA